MIRWWCADRIGCQASHVHSGIEHFLGAGLPDPVMGILGVFCLYLVLIIPLIPMEEDGLQNAYGEQYGAYQQKTSKLIPSCINPCCQ